MPNLTVRNIPETVLQRLRTLSATERRSLNSEILLLLEIGLREQAGEAAARPREMDAALQGRLWRRLCGAWKDTRSAAEISADIVRRRTRGRKVEV